MLKNKDLIHHLKVLLIVLVVCMFITTAAGWVYTTKVKPRMKTDC